MKKSIRSVLISVMNENILKAEQIKAEYALCITAY